MHMYMHMYMFIFGKTLWAILKFATKILQRGYISWGINFEFLESHNFATCYYIYEMSH